MRGLILLLGIVLLLAMVVFIPTRIYLSFKVASELDRIREAGFPVDYEGLNEWYKAVPDDENAALLYLAAADALEEEINRFPEEKYDLLPVFGHLAEEDGEAYSDATLSAMQEFLEANAQALELLEKAGRLNESRYPIDLSLGPFAGMDHFSKLRQVTRLLALEAESAAEMGEAHRATRAICDAKAAARSLDKEPQMTSQLVRFALDGLAWGALQEVLTRLPLTDAQLGRLTQAFDGKQYSEILSRTMAGERAAEMGYMDLSLLDIMNAMDSDAADLQKDVVRTEDPVQRLSRASGLTHVRKLDSLDAWDQVLDAATLAMPNALAAAKAIDSRLAQMPPFRARPILANLWSVETSFTVFARNQAHSQTARTALAVERYRLARGQLPETLSDLLPDYLDEIPTDPFDGQPLRYRQLETGYVIFSVGSDFWGDTEEEPEGDAFPNAIRFPVHR